LYRFPISLLIDSLIHHPKLPITTLLHGTPAAAGRARGVWAAHRPNASINERTSPITVQSRWSRKAGERENSQPRIGFLSCKTTSTFLAGSGSPLAGSSSLTHRRCALFHPAILAKLLSRLIRSTLYRIRFHETDQLGAPGLVNFGPYSSGSYDGGISSAQGSTREPPEREFLSSEPGDEP
jgi:hypothetical protein